MNKTCSLSLEQEICEGNEELATKNNEFKVVSNGASVSRALTFWFRGEYKRLFSEDDFESLFRKFRLSASNCRFDESLFLEFGNHLAVFHVR